MKSSAPVCTTLGTLLLWTVLSVQGKPPQRRLPKDRDSFFVENNLVYSRYLSLSHDGTYRQINQDRTGTAEVDRGRWEQGGDAVVLLHSEQRGLRFRAVRSGPLTVVLDSAGKIEALPQVAAAIRRLLETSQDDIFEADTAHDLSVAPAEVFVDRQAETFGRSDLVSLAAQSDDVYRTEQTRTYRLTPIHTDGGPPLLVLQWATFGPEQVEPVGREYHVASGEAPPFYFAQTDARTFANRVGHYQILQLPGGPSNP